MIISERELAILSLVEQFSVVSMRTISRQLPEVSVVTLRRDLARMERDGKLTRTRGGAARCATQAPTVDDGEDVSADVLILPPLTGRWARTLRAAARECGKFYLAESAPQAGGVYLGPENRKVGRELGELAAANCMTHASHAEILVITQVELSNTQERTAAFVEGFRAVFRGPVIEHIVEGRGEFDFSLRQATDAFAAYPGINVLFGVNDHAILAALEAAAARPKGSDVFAWSVGGEGDAVFDALASGGALKGVGALFPEVCGQLAIDAIARHLARPSLDDGTSPVAQAPSSDVAPMVEATPIITPFAIITARNIDDYYVREHGHWSLLGSQLNRMTEQPADAPAVLPRALTGRSVRLVLHYPGHEWYRKLASAMRTRATVLGLSFSTRQAASETEIGIRAIRRVIASAAADTVTGGEIILIDAGAAAQLFAQALGMRRSLGELTVFTNSLEVADSLAAHPRVRLHLTGGEYDPQRRCLSGAGVAASLSGLRADRAFISPDGVSPGFGLSWQAEPAAFIGRQMIGAARHVTVLADHSVVGFEASVLGARIAEVHSVITDAGTLPSQRLELAEHGLCVSIANGMRRAHRTEAPTAR